MRFHLARRVFNPTYLFSVLYTCLVFEWNIPTVVILSIPHGCAAPPYRAFSIQVQPVPGGRQLTTAVVAAVIDQMLGALANSELNPGLFHVLLTTQESPPAPIGRIWTTYAAGAVPTKVRHLMKLESTLNASAIVEDGLNTTMDIQSSLMFNSRISTTVRLNGQSARYGPILPKWWLNAFYHISKLLFRQTSSGMAYRLREPLAAVRFDVGRDYRLVAQVSSRRVPRGQNPLTWGELVAGIAPVLEEVIVEQRFEAFDAEIYKDGWLAAIYVLSQHPVGGPGSGDVEIE